MALGADAGALAAEGLPPAAALNPLDEEALAATGVTPPCAPIAAEGPPLADARCIMVGIRTAGLLPPAATGPW